MLCFQWGCLLFLTHFLSGCHPLDCDTKSEYEWPDINPTWCCKKCHPGQFMQKRCMKDVGTVCSSCGVDNYRDDFNYEFKCKRCSECTKPNMEPKKSCTPTSNTECGCKSGFICNNDQCDQCVKLPPTTTKPPPTTTTKTTTVMPTIKPTRRTPTSFDTHLHVDGQYQHLKITVFGTQGKAQQLPVSAQRRRRCRCPSRRCAEERSIRKTSESDRVVMRERGKRLHMSVWVEY
ncbi:tumor necrosis factor receptor superfamily member 5 isoform X2 [Astyanax mexicanus]|uniref:tumor necrosis factor receptor superfamily member 5 isoform X2 n=1 Tax=Astyanax mexicanus TaxID=7994 RepID=UPI0020CB4656|nr:tumor necrosis factor receptor superfamily member 5 isoform X2 [Astyanax mexicanus]